RAEVRARVINLLNDASLYPESKILGFAETILNDTDEDVKKAALEYLTNSKNRALLPLLEEIGAHNDSLRHNARIAVLRLKIAVDPMAAFTEVPSSARDVSTEMLRLLAERIVSIPSAYYNVVCWLDRTLYSPVALIPAFKKRFQKEIGDLASWCVVHSDSLNTTSA
ncbi:MAG TPA: hypothetical protein VIH59_10390, partial [Candidatus Tectomicrobia bacterium]